MGLPPGVRFTLTGAAEKLDQAWDAMVFSLIIAVTIVYLVMAILFESFVYPLIIMFSVPLAAAGGGAGLIKSGRHIKYPDETLRPTNLQLTLLNKLKVPTQTFGDSTGEQLRELSDL